MEHQAKFTVDTHLFRELGELLVGRNSTALIELLKNAYDADATEVVVVGTSLSVAKSAKLIIRDDGNGMTPAQFRNGFLRVASRLKESGERRSPRYKRRYTGAKGIGRLAAHKLASSLQIISYPNDHNQDSEGEGCGVIASIDWNEIEKLNTLDEVEASGAVLVGEVESLPSRSAGIRLVKPGTVIELSRLRRGWSDSDRAIFLAEVQSYTPSDVLIDRSLRNVPDRLLFDRARSADAKTKNSGFRIRLEGELQGGEEYWQNLVQSAQFLFEVESDPDAGIVTIGICPTASGRKHFSAARRRVFRIPHPDASTGLAFQSRVFVREGGGGSTAERRWLGRSSGIRVFMEGFRVLPYGEPNDDWLSLGADYKRRSRTIPLLDSLPGAGDAADEDEGLVALSNDAYYGAVFLVQDGAKSLKMLVNREGFLPEAGYQTLVEIMRKAVYLTVRYRAALKRPDREERRSDREVAAATRQEAASKLDLRKSVEAAVENASMLAKEARQAAARNDFGTAITRINEAAAAFSRGSDVSQRLMTEGSILRVLASVGMQMASFVHEINSLLGSAVAVEGVLDRIRRDAELPTRSRQQLSTLQVAVGELRRSVERQAAYLTDVVSPDARRRRSRQRIAERFDAAARLIFDSAQRLGIVIENKIPLDLKSPPMFQAEVTTVFTNLLTNALKAAGKNGRIRAMGHTEEGSVFRVENTGTAVDLNESERWFRPFESTTDRVDPVLGQGMGMGLPITRNMLGEYGATILFVKPASGFASAIEIRFPE